MMNLRKFILMGLCWLYGRSESPPPPPQEDQENSCMLLTKPVWPVEGQAERLEPG